MVVEKLVELHEQQIGALAATVKNLELEHNTVSFQLTAITDSLQDIKGSIILIKDTLNDQSHILEQVKSLSNTVGELNLFKNAIEKRIDAEDVRKDQIKGFAKVIKSNWGLFAAIVSVVLLFLGAVDAAYKSPSPGQTQEMKTIIEKISSTF